MNFLKDKKFWALLGALLGAIASSYVPGPVGAIVPTIVQQVGCSAMHCTPDQESAVK